jgi:uncharacterized protein involved in exopolysaccharide biosynthesis
MAIHEPPTQSPPPFDYRRFIPRVPDPLVAVFDVLSPASLLAMVKRYWWLLVGATAAGAAFAFYQASKQPTNYTTTARFIVGQGATQLSPLAAQLGLSGGGSLLESPAFIEDLLHSRELLWGVANAPLKIDSLDPARDTTILEVLGIKDTLPLRAKEIAVGTLRGWIGVSQGPNSILELTVTTNNPRLSSALALEAINQVSRFNFDMKQRRLDAERTFIERRLQITERELREAEARLRAFLQQNRNYGQASDLQFQHERLTSEVGMRRNFYQSAVMAHESARVEETKDVPMTTLLEAPDIPLRPNSRPKGRSTLVGAIAGFMLATLLVLLLDLRRRVMVERAALR